MSDAGGYASSAMFVWLVGILFGPDFVVDREA